nr:hypothetical protein [Kofleriaceae bacterium]
MRGLLSTALLVALLAALVVLDRTGLAPSAYRVSPVTALPADLAVYAIVAVAALAAALAPPRHRRSILLVAGATALPVALGPWSLALAGFVAVALAAPRAPVPLIVRCAVVLAAWLVVPALRIHYLGSQSQADTILLAQLWIGMLVSALYLVVERARALPGEASTLHDDTFYLLAPPRVVIPFFQPISPREVIAAQRNPYPKKLLARAAWLAVYGLALAVAAARLDDLRPHFIRPVGIAIEFVAHYAQAARSIILAVAVFRLLGYDLPPGFRLPFLSRSFAEFFRRFNHYVRDSVVSLFYFPTLGHIRHKLPRRAASIAAAYIAIFAGSLALQDLLIPCGISVRPLHTARVLLRPRRIFAMLTMWTLIVVPNAGIIPKRKGPAPKWRVALQIAIVDTVYAVLWYLESHG